jgi:hypothetical protein
LRDFEGTKAYNGQGVALFNALVIDEKTQSTAACASFLVLTTFATSLTKSPLFISFSFHQF